MQPIEPIEQSWDKKKIIIGLVSLFMLIGAGYAAKIIVLDKNTLRTFSVTRSPGLVAGARVEKKDDPENKEKIPSFSGFSATIQTNAAQKLDAIKEQVANLKVEEIASSSPQVQKLINDLKTLEQYPKSQAKQMCENVCKSL